ncbi:MAG: hypothetical protein KUG77_11640 [Nannocystaceae bacterium]|nr:hypothetical protein [Nannocystaceae bacterium]
MGTGLVTCVLACSAPLIAAVTGGALLASGVVAAAFLSRLEVVGSGVMALGAIALASSYLVKRRRSREHSLDPALASRSCGPMCTTDEAPIACTLNTASGKERAGEFRQVFERAYLRGERLSHGVRWRFSEQDGLLDDLRSLARREHECCLFFDFRVEPHGDEIWWETRTSAAGAPVLEEFYRLPQSLLELEVEDLIPRMTAKFDDAGGTFGPGKISNA